MKKILSVLLLAAILTCWTFPVFGNEFPDHREAIPVHSALVDDPLQILSISTDPNVVYADQPTTFTVDVRGGVPPYRYEIWLYCVEDPMDGINESIAFYDKDRFVYTRPADQSGLFYVDANVWDSTGAMAFMQSNTFSSGEDETSYRTVEGQVNAIVSENITAGMTSYEKAKVLHDWLTHHAHYSTQAEMDADTDSRYQFTEGVLLQGHGVCQSYTQAYRLLCNRAGVPCVTVSGVAGGETHIWNQICLDGDWYMVDCTWDDPANGSREPVSGSEMDAYFCLTDEELRADHTWEQAYACTATLYGIRHLSQPMLESISIDPVQSVRVGETATVRAQLNPAQSRHHALKWTSSDETVLEINQNGQIGGLKAGTATVTCSESDGKHPVTCVVTVTNVDGVPELTPAPSVRPTPEPDWNTDPIPGPSMNPDTMPTPKPTPEPIIAGDEFEISEDRVLRSYTGKSEKVEIPQGVIGIGDEAFRGHGEITSVTIPNTVEYIGAGAFFECRGLTSVKIPGSVTEIGNDAFSFCTGLKTVTLNEGLTSIYSYAFHHCHSLKSIAIPASVIWICPYSAFGDCNSLEKITVASGNGMYRSEGNCLINGTTVIKGCKTSVIPEGITAIGRAAFSETEGITDIRLPDSVELIDVDAFSWCKDLESINFPSGLKEIRAAAFHGTKLKKVSLPAGTTCTLGNPFSDCNELSSVTVATGNPYLRVEGNCLIDTVTGTLISGTNSSVIPAGISGIGDDAFRELTGITQFHVPEGVTSIGNNAFYHADNLAVLTLPDSLTWLGDTALADCRSLKSLRIPDQITKIGDFQIQCCPSLETLTLPKGLRTVGNWAITEATGLKEIILPDGTVSVGEGAFCGTWDLRTVVIPASVTVIGEGAFTVYSETVIYGEPGSAAEKYAKQNSCIFRDIREWSTPAPDVALAFPEELPDGVLVLKKGAKYTLIPEIEPAAALHDVGLTYKSSKKTVAKISSSGVITALKNGETKITVTAKNGGGAKLTLRVIVGTPISKVKLNRDTVILKKGKTLTLTATLSPEKPSYGKVVWMSSNPKIATVSSSGKITAKKNGTCVITCMAADGSGIKAACTVHVGTAVTKLTLNKTKLSLKKGKSETLKVTFTPGKASFKTVTWTSSDPKIATVDGNGKVKAKKKGTCTVTCAATDGSGVVVKCKVTVK